MKKSTKGFLLGVTAAAAAFGTYYVVKNKDKIFKSDDKFDEGDDEETRSYVDLDNIKEKTNEAVSKTKEVAQGTWDKAKDKFESLKKNLKKEETAETEANNVAEEIILPAEDVEEIAPENTPE